MNANLRQVADAHAAVFEMTDYLATQWSATLQDVQPLVDQAPFRPELNTPARVKLDAFRAQMMKSIETSLIQLGVTPDEKSTGPAAHPPLPRGWDMERFQRWTWDQFGNSNHIKRDLERIITAAQNSGQTIRDNFYNPAKVVEIVPAEFSLMAALAQHHFGLYETADQKANAADGAGTAEPLRTSAATAVVGGSATPDRAPQMRYLDL